MDRCHQVFQEDNKRQELEEERTHAEQEIEQLRAKHQEEEEKLEEARSTLSNPPCTVTLLPNGVHHFCYNVVLMRFVLLVSPLQVRCPTKRSSSDR